ncbi:MAG: PEP-CTERM sorting domain-containing protein [Myxococcota bacterium]
MEAATSSIRFIARAPRSCGILAALALLVWLPSVSFASGIAGPGISLAELIDGGSFTSKHDRLRFSDFEADGEDPDDLGHFRLIPIKNGFKFSSHDDDFEGDDPNRVVLHYSVEASAEFAVGKIQLDYRGDANAEVSMAVSNDAMVNAANLFVDRDHREDKAGLDPHLLRLWVDEAFELRGDHHSHEGIEAKHRFLAGGDHDHDDDIDPVPEPGTAALLAGGLVFMSMTRRRTLGG